MLSDSYRDVSSSNMQISPHFFHQSSGSEQKSNLGWFVYDVMYEALFRVYVIIHASNEILESIKFQGSTF